MGLKVSVVTPVYNGERFLAEALQSVLDQTYQNWELVLLDNNSSDATAQIAQSFCERDSRIKIFTNDATVSVIDNHNLVVQHMSPDADLCKVLHADDTLEPQALERMVALADAHPTVGVIGAWSEWGGRIMSRIEPDGQACFSGEDIARRTLMGEIYPFLSPSSLLIRNSVLAARPQFYQSNWLHADVDAMYSMLKNTDFGLVHETLVHVRRHDESVTNSTAKPMNTLLASNLELLAHHGPIFLKPDELAQRFDTQLDRYYTVLGRCLVEGRSAEFWAFHRRALAAAGFPLSRLRLSGVVLADLILRPRRFFRALRKRR